MFDQANTRSAPWATPFSACSHSCARRLRTQASGRAPGKSTADSARRAGQALLNTREHPRPLVQLHDPQRREHADVVRAVPAIEEDHALLEARLTDRVDLVLDAAEGRELHHPADAAAQLGLARHSWEPLRVLGDQRLGVLAEGGVVLGDQAVVARPTVVVAAA